ncbi:CpaF family protein [Phaeobacter italicus]|jgi:pilus assembly protein CpaF|uniref:Putative conjugal transfer proteinc/MT3759 n=1 Tax=Phaeobacter italicus TaxID=481446 RepID=A0A0H5D099_9RHOB|nr:CpaF family protein [Phaeobacter italicus]EEB69932.1 type II secretion system protein E [Ruegeria sp. R11]MEE2817131.1 CpaF family protein [Pseudomonadota bacterium]MBY6043518.1 CpaF family protein [Phaeobacter italicus]CRL10474.1 Putative conjugal transfer proteinc/MT3759 [Phaeobacter italicus]CRL15616.1 Putative conjugal transfer proteinc/MT3759 [Phaeobacter italicus]
MFSKYKRQSATAKPVTAAQPKAAPAPEAQPKAPAPAAATLRKPAARTKAEAAPADKERKRKERMGEIKIQLHRELLENLNLAALERASEAELRAEISSIASEILEERGIVLNREDRQTLNKELYDEVTGLGPLETLLQDDTVSDILVNGPQQVFVEREGKLQLSDVTFKDEKHLMRIIDKIVSAVGRRVDESNPYVDARLADGSRFNAMVPPIAVDGSLVSIRKFKKDKLGIDDLVNFGAFTEEMAAYLQAAVSTRLNVIVSGGTGSGKTTTLNALSSFIDNAERILTIEDTAELQLQQTHVGRMESRPPNVEGKGEVSPRDCLKNALRMRPDRIIVGETRGEEVIDMLQAMNTGHDGSMTTIHANSARDGISRLENMIAMAGIEMPIKAVRSQIASAVNLIVQASRLQDGSRRMTSITEITGMEGDVISMQEIFRFQRVGLTPDNKIIGHFTATGVRSHFSERFRLWGYDLPPSIYEPTVMEAR